jgi:hypothetical protein
MSHYPYLIIGSGMTAAAAIQGIGVFAGPPKKVHYG